MSLTQQIKEKLEKALDPVLLEVVNESDKHIGHAGHNGSGESHFKVFIVSDAFIGCNRIQRQKIIYKILDFEIIDLIHAISIDALAPDEVAHKK